MACRPHRDSRRNILARERVVALDADCDRARERPKRKKKHSGYGAKSKPQWPRPHQRANPGKNQNRTECPERGASEKDWRNYKV